MRYLPLVVGLSLSSLGAQPYASSHLQALQWRLVGPFRAGRVVTATGVSSQPHTFYFGAVGGGIWKTTDAGTVWKPIFDSQPVASIGALEVAPSDPNILYAGTGEADWRSDIAFGNGIYKSTDAGQTWQHLGLADTLHIGRIVIHPRNPDLVYVAAMGHAYASHPERGVYRSQDGGRTWRKVLDKGPDVGAVDLSLAPDQPDLLYAAVWQARRTPWSQYPPLGGPGSGLYRSTDGGSTWSQVAGHGLPTTEWGRAGVVIAPGTRGQRVYALIDGKDPGLYRSDDGGQAWQRVSTDARLTSRGWYFGFITVDPRNPDVVYVPNVALYKSVDGGKTFTVLRGAPGGDDYHSLWIDPDEPARMILGTDQGTTISLNGGETWSTWYNQPTGQFYHVITDHQVPYFIYGAQQDSGTAAVPSRTTHGHITERDFSSVGGGESGYVAPDPKDPNIVYSTNVYGTVSRFDKRTSQAQNVTPWPVPAFGIEMPGRKYRAPWTAPLVFSPVDGTTLYFGTQYLLKTTDGGLHWQAISPDLTGDARAGTTSAGTGPPTVENAKARGYGVIYTVAPSPLQAPLIWVGSDTGVVHVTHNGGRTWSNVTPPGLSDWSKITHIEASHFDDGTAYVAVDRHRLDDYAPHLYRTRDSGKTWTEVVAGLGPNAFLNAIREDPKRKGLLFAATETGVAVSFDDADHWQPLQLTLPAASVRDLVIEGDDLVIGTHGRAFWVLDNITPLRQLNAAVARAGTWLYEPATALRVWSEAFQGTPLPPEIPAARNPPDGAVVDYVLAAAPTQPVTLEIVSAAGQIVRRFSSAKQAKVSTAPVPVADLWRQPSPGLTAQAGLNRFVWDLRSVPPEAEEENETGAPDDEAGPRGLLVPPGEYQVRLTVDGKVLRQRLRVKQDPRSPVPLAVLQQQFSLGQKVSEELHEARELLRERPDLKQQLTPVIAQLAGALSAITSADRTPPAQAIAAANEAAQKLEAIRSTGRTATTGERTAP